MTDEQIMRVAEHYGLPLNMSTWNFARALLAASAEQEADPPPTGFASWKDAALDERMKRVALQRQIANPSDKQVTKITNAMLDAAVAAFKDRPEYSVRESMRAAIAASLPQSAEQEAVAEIVRYETFTGRTAWDIKIRDTSLKNGALLYAAPIAQSAEQDRIDAADWLDKFHDAAMTYRAARVTEAPAAFEYLVQIAKGASK